MLRLLNVSLNYSLDCHRTFVLIVRILPYLYYFDFNVHQPLGRKLVNNKYQLHLLYKSLFITQKKRCCSIKH